MFYPSSEARLRESVQSFLRSTSDSEPAIGIVSPHAGYIYSGPTAGSVFSRVSVPGTVVILAPNHTGRGSAYGGASIIPRGAFVTPLGEVPVEDSLANDLLERSSLIREDPAAHEEEHSLEVQLPFLQVLRKDVSIVPLVTNYDSYGPARAVGEALAGAIGDSSSDTLILASSDMTHYRPRDVTKRLDKLAIERIEELDPEGLLRVTKEEGITMCGRAPVATMLVAAKLLGATGAALIDYTDSGDASGDTSRVVGYAGIVVS